MEDDNDSFDFDVYDNRGVIVYMAGEDADGNPIGDPISYAAYHLAEFGEADPYSFDAMALVEPQSLDERMADTGEDDGETATVVSLVQIDATAYDLSII